MGRNTQGVRLVNLKEGDRLVALEIVSEQDLEKYAAEVPVERTAPSGAGELSPAEGNGGAALEGDTDEADEGEPDELAGDESEPES